MHNSDAIGDFVAGSRLQGNDWLLPYAKLAQEFGKELTVFDDGSESPMIRVTDLETRHWLELPLDGNTEDTDIDRLIRNFPDIYAQIVPIEDPQDFEESLPIKIVDILIEGDLDDFMSGFSQSQEREGGRPLDPAPTGRNVLRAVQFETGHKLYLWRSDKQREHYGSGPNSYYLGYRFVSPTGLIIYEDSGFHPGGGWNGEITDDVVLMLIQGLVLGNQDIDEEDLAAMTPEQRAWLEDPDRERIEMDVGGLDSIQDGPPPWRELKVRGRRQRS